MAKKGIVQQIQGFLWGIINFVGLFFSTVHPVRPSFLACVVIINVYPPHNVRLGQLHSQTTALDTQSNKYHQITHNPNHVQATREQRRQAAVERRAANMAPPPRSTFGGASSGSGSGGGGGGGGGLRHRGANIHGLRPASSAPSMPGGGCCGSTCG